MLTNHQKTFLKHAANSLRPLYQIGKNKLGPTQLQLLDKGLTARELIKVSVLKNSDSLPASLAVELSAQLHAEVVQIVGRIITLYRANPLNHHYELPRS